MSIVPKAGPDVFSFEGDTTPEHLQGVSFWPRVAARLIDIVLHLVIAVVSGVVVAIGAALFAGLTGQPFEPLIDRLGVSSISTFVFSLLGALGYQTICEGMAGSSLGKRILGFTVVKEDGSPCTIRSAFVRSLSYLLDSLFLGIVAYLAMKPPLQQRHGDGWAHTVVVYGKKLAPERQRGPARFLGVLLLGVLFDGAMITISLLVKLL